VKRGKKSGKLVEIGDKYDREEFQLVYERHP
jgi:hypothetical protein